VTWGNIIDFGTIGGAPQSNIMCGQNVQLDRVSCRAIEPQDVTRAVLYHRALRFAPWYGPAFSVFRGSRIFFGGFRVNGPDRY
jgi:hypothetical protein